MTLTGGNQEARCVGRVRRQIQISRQRTGSTRAGDEPKLTALAAESSRAVRAGRAQQNHQYQNNICVSGITGKPVGTRGGKTLKEERFPSTMTWSDLMTPGEADLGWLPKAPAARPHPAVGEPESKRGNGRSTSPKRFRFSDVAQNSLPIRQNTFSPVQNTY